MTAYETCYDTLECLWTDRKCALALPQFKLKQSMAEELKVFVV